MLQDVCSRGTSKLLQADRIRTKPRLQTPDHGKNGLPEVNDLGGHAHHLRLLGRSCKRKFPAVASQHYYLRKRKIAHVVMHVLGYSCLVLCKAPELHVDLQSVTPPTT